MRLLRNLGVVSGLTMASRVLGLARDVLMASRLGAGPLTDVFYQALTIPNTFRRVLAEGAFNAAFVPLYARELEGAGQAEAERFASEALSFMATVTALLVVAFQVLAPWLVYAFIPGVVEDPGLAALGALMLQIMMPYLLCMVVVAVIGGGLNSHGRFAAAAAAPMLFNLAMIAALVFRFADAAELTLWLSVSVTVSGLMQVALLWTAAERAKLHFRLRMPKLTPRVRRLLALGVPGAIAAGATQINVLVTSSISTLEEAARTYLYFAERLYQLPLGVIGIAMGLALLPNLARRVRSGDEAGGHFAMNRAIELSLALTLPATIAFLVIPGFLIEGILERDAFTSADTANTALALAAFALGLPAFIMIKVLTPGFFAREDTRTPMRFALWSVGLNLVLALALFFGGLGFMGLALAASIAGWLNAVLLAVTLRARGLLQVDARLRSRLPRLLGASVVMGVAVWLAAGPGAEAAREALPMLVSGWGRLALLFGVVGLGGAVYAAACMATGALRISEFAEAIRPAKGARPEPGGPPEI